MMNLSISSTRSIMLISLIVSCTSFVVTHTSTKQNHFTSFPNSKLSAENGGTISTPQITSTPTPNKRERQVQPNNRTGYRGKSRPPANSAGRFEWSEFNTKLHSMTLGNHAKMEDASEFFLTQLNAVNENGEKKLITDVHSHSIIYRGWIRYCTYHPLEQYHSLGKAFDALQQLEESYLENTEDLTPAVAIEVFGCYRSFILECGRFIYTKSLRTTTNTDKQQIARVLSMAVDILEQLLQNLERLVDGASNSKSIGMPNPLDDENIIRKLVTSIMKAPMTHDDAEKVLRLVLNKIDVLKSESTAPQYEKYIHPDTRHFNVVLRKCAALSKASSSGVQGELPGKVNSLFQLLIEYVQPDSESYSSLLYTLVNTGSYEEMITLMDQFSKDAFKKKVDVDENAVKCFKTILNTLCGETNNNRNRETVQYAETVLTYMDAMSKLRREMTPTVYQYTTLINGYAFVGDNASSERILELVLANDSRNNQADTILYNAVLRSLANSPSDETLGRAVSIVEMMEGKPTQMEWPNFTTYKLLLKCYLNQPKNAAEPSPYVLSTLCSKMIYHKPELNMSQEEIPLLPHEIASILIGMVHNNIDWDSRHFYTCVHALAKSTGPIKPFNSAPLSQSEQCESLLNFMTFLHHETKDATFKPSKVTFNVVIDKFAKAGRSKQAESIVDRMEHRSQTPGMEYMSPDTFSYNSLINAHARSMNYESALKAEAVLRKMQNLCADSVKSSPGSKPNVRPDVISYGATLDAFARSKSKQGAIKAEQILKLMYDEYRLDPQNAAQPNVRHFNCVLNAHAQSSSSGAAQRAEQLLKRMEELAGAGNPQLIADTISFNTVINCWAKSPQKDSAAKAEAVLYAMERKFRAGKLKDGPNRISFNAVMDAWSRSGEVGAALACEDLLSRMINLHVGGRTELRPDVQSFSICIMAWANSGEKNSARRAEQIFRLMGQEYLGGNAAAKPNTVSYNSLIHSLARSKESGSARKAESLLRRMNEKMLAGDMSVKPDHSTYTSVISAFANSMDASSVMKAQSVMNSMEQNGVKPSGHTYTALISAWGRSHEDNKAERAQDILHEITNLHESGNDFVKPTIASYNAVLNACAYTNTDNIEVIERAFKVGCATYDELCKSTYAKPDDVTYANFLKICSSALPESDLKRQVVNIMFRRCKRDGLVSSIVLRHLQDAASEELCEKLLESKVVDKSYDLVGLEDLPSDWTRNVKEW